MILYHGSNVEVHKPRLLRFQRPLDFGNGFYLTTDKVQAVRWAKRVQQRNRNGVACVNAYEVDEEALAKLRVLAFHAPDSAWLRFVVSNRRHVAVNEGWDVINGPVADDQTSAVIDLFLSGIYDEDEAVRRLLPQKLSDQWTFKTDGAIAILHFVEAIKA